VSHLQRGGVPEYLILRAVMIVSVRELIHPYDFLRRAPFGYGTAIVYLLISDFMVTMHAFAESSAVLFECLICFYVRLYRNLSRIHMLSFGFNHGS
jgi:hypothetical protein